MRQRLVTYLTLVSTLVLPVVVVMWGRSFLTHDIAYRVGGGGGLVASTVRGELSLWAGPTEPGTEVRRGAGSNEAGRIPTVRERFRRRSPDAQAWFAGFGVARTTRFPYRLGPGSGPVWCLAVPYWFLALASGVLPARVLLQHMLEEDRRRKDSPRRCARCEYDLQAWHRWCPECGERVHDGPPLPRATHA